MLAHDVAEAVSLHEASSPIARLATTTAYVLSEYAIAQSCSESHESSVIFRDRGLEDTQYVAHALAKTGVVPLSLCRMLESKHLLHADTLVVLEVEHAERQRRLSARNRSAMSAAASCAWEQEFGLGYMDWMLSRECTLIVIDTTSRSPSEVATEILLKTSASR